MSALNQDLVTMDTRQISLTVAGAYLTGSSATSRKCARVVAVSLAVHDIRACAQPSSGLVARGATVSKVTTDTYAPSW
jgi:hypothetical protein